MYPETSIDPLIFHNRKITVCLQVQLCNTILLLLYSFVFTCCYLLIPSYLLQVVI